MITAYSRGKKYRWMPWSLSMKGCRRQTATSRRGDTTLTPACHGFEQDGNTGCEEAAKKRAQLQGRTVKALGLAATRLVQGSAALASRGSVTAAGPLGAERSKRRWKGAAGPGSAGRPCRDPRVGLVKALDTREQCEHCAQRERTHSPPTPRRRAGRGEGEFGTLRG